ncbi:hypothetical protein AVEN_177305-1 [Araneus ventricosus]|uniref:Uncharacterized protein n=1 Tax=Araneus ventricosus TaxID=182803 RepID=A0A4Y2C4J0_ARAVE|nr:hypothetical protein AVEN_177305-1 [Araneus ventricosus]
MLPLFLNDIPRAPPAPRYILTSVVAQGLEENARNYVRRISEVRGHVLALKKLGRDSPENVLLCCRKNKCAVVCISLISCLGHVLGCLMNTWFLWTSR